MIDRDNTGFGRVGCAETGSRKRSQRAVSALSGFDPARIDRIIAMGEQAKRLNEESKHDGAGE